MNTPVISIRGPPGAGKSTLAKRLHEAFANAGWTAAVFHSDTYLDATYPKAHRHALTGLPNYDADAAYDLIALANDVDTARNDPATRVVIVEGIALHAAFPSDYAVYLSKDKAQCYDAICKRKGRPKPTRGYFHYVTWPQHVARIKAWMALNPTFYSFYTRFDIEHEIADWVLNGTTPASHLSPNLLMARELAEESQEEYADVSASAALIEIVGRRAPFEPGSYADRVFGMLWLHALGDALGMAYEFYTRNAPTYDGRLEHIPRRNSRRGRLVGILGQTSDDTAMTVALLRALTEKDLVYDRERVLKSYLYWGSGNVNSMGRNTRRLLEVSTPKGYENRRAKYVAEMEASHSNGPLMRCAPLALIANAEARHDAVVTDCDLTNTSQYNKDINLAYVAHLVDALAGRPLQPRGEDNQLINDRNRNIAGKDKGLAGHAYWCALQVANQYPQPGDAHNALDWIIARGGDTDTNAAIAGALLGARAGLTALLEDARIRKHMLMVLKTDATWTDFRCGGSYYHPVQYKASLLSRFLPAEEEAEEGPPRKRARLA